MLKSFLKDVEGNKFTNEKEQFLDREKQPLTAYLQYAGFLAPKKVLWRYELLC